MIAVSFIGIPFLAGLLLFWVRKDSLARALALTATLINLWLAVGSLTVYQGSAHLQWDASWMPAFGSRFSLGLEGMGSMMVLLTAVSFPLIFIATWHTQYKRAPYFYALMLWSQAGLMGVFTATDALLFYFFWELALIPAYFLCSLWGGERRIAVTFKFFIYTFIGSLFLLIGLAYLYFQTPDQSFSLQSFYKTQLSPDQQSWLFWLFFIAFAIKMPLFPFHSWQPDTYEQAPVATTMVLSGIMVKMGLFGLIRWLAPVMPYGFWAWGDSVSFLAMFGMIYASLLAMLQDDLKKLVAYSSIAHIGLMCLAVFSTTATGLQGTLIQMFSHGINIIGLWMVVELIERQTGTTRMSALGGLAQKAPVLSLLLVVIALANVALPLTNAFVGEFLMFTGVFTSNVSLFNYIYVSVAGVSIILSAVYTLTMIQKVFFGEVGAQAVTVTDIRLQEKGALAAIVLMILVFGVYPQPLLDLGEGTVQQLLQRMITKHP